jgi:hypothetical protein
VCGSHCHSSVSPLLSVMLCVTVQCRRNLNSTFYRLPRPRCCGDLPLLGKFPRQNGESYPGPHVHQATRLAVCDRSNISE